MANRNQRVGGFSGFNTGSIHNCRSDVSLRAGELCGGFCGENRGDILNCFGKGHIRKRKDAPGSGFCARQSGKMEGCFWFCRDLKNRGGEAWSDWEQAVDAENPQTAAAARTQSWDSSVWNTETEEPQLYEKAYESPKGVSVVEISGREDLLRAAADVNSGACQRNTVYRLTQDIDLDGHLWTPMGLDKNAAFFACFDGAGHTISNFRIHAKDNPYAAFFGYVGKQGEIHHLTLDGVVSGRGTCTAGFCAVNDGTITDCIARSSVSSGRYSGGFAAQNNGKIERCSAVGRIAAALPFAWWAGPLALAILFLILMALLGLLRPQKSKDVFAPVILDPNAQPIPVEENIPAPQEEEMTDSSASFIMNANMHVGANYTGVINLRCPSWSKKGLVATVEVMGDELKENGAEYQKNAVVYQSGLVSPGMGIDVITLGKLPDGSSIPSGSYTLQVTFDFYDPETNERAAVNSTAPLDVVID